MLGNNQLPQDLGLWIRWHLVGTFNDEVKISLLLGELGQLCKYRTLIMGTERRLGTRGLGLRHHIHQQCLKLLFQLWCLKIVLLN